MKKFTLFKIDKIFQVISPRKTCRLLRMTLLFDYFTISLIRYWAIGVSEMVDKTCIKRDREVVKADR